MTALLLATVLTLSTPLPLDYETYPTDPPQPVRQLIPAPPVEPVDTRPQPNPEAGPVEQWRPLVSAYDGWDVNVMLDIMWCESRGVPTAQNPRSTATGLFQIMWSVWYADHGPRSDLHDPWLNVEIARQVWGVQGYGAWVCWN